MGVSGWVGGGGGGADVYLSSASWMTWSDVVVWRWTWRRSSVSGEDCRNADIFEFSCSHSCRSDSRDCLLFGGVEGAVGGVVVVEPFWWWALGERSGESLLSIIPLDMAGRCVGRVGGEGGWTCMYYVGGYSGYLSAGASLLSSFLFYAVLLPRCLQ